MIILIFFINLILLFPVWANPQSLPEDFLLGISNASAQVEDQLNDSWMSTAKMGKINAFHNHPKPEIKLEFWSKPEIEINLAHSLGAQIFRMSIDWQRLVPIKSKNVTQADALKHYQKTIQLIKAKKMKVMLTLFHHSLPTWAIEMGGWANPEIASYFVGFAKDVFNALNQDVDYWNTFNEANVFALFTYVAGIWPPMNGSIINMLNLPFYKGNFFLALDNMALAHNEFYQFAHQININAKIGIAQNTANYKPHSVFSALAVWWSWNYMNYYFPDLVKSHLDFLGINYYGAEYLTLNGIAFSKNSEYNDAGRAIDPNGLLEIIKKFSDRYALPIHITENGIADESDIFRSLYIREHLKAIMAAIKVGIAVKSYIHWTLTDNFEWSDGYCPKFGLVSVNRNTMQRTPKNSFYYYKNIIENRKIQADVSEDILWETYISNIGKNRTMCRAENAKDSLDLPRKIPLSNIDWRFKDTHSN